MKKILIVEDEVFLLNEIANWLSYEGMDVIKAADGHSAIRLTEAELPDLILSDILMPEMDGRTLLNSIRKLPGGEGIPFIFMSALSERTDIRAGMEIGADDYLTKPFTHSELLKAIDARLEKADLVKKQSDDLINNLQNRILTQLPSEISEPINSILGLAGLLAEQPAVFTHDELANMGHTILERGMHLHRLAENYLMYVNMELIAQPAKSLTSGSKLEPVIFEESFAIARKYDRITDLYVDVEPANLEIEEKLLRKIVRELTDNAFRFSEPATPVILKGTKNGEYFELRISDKGEGMPINAIKNIGAYMQFSNKIPLKKGSGLGLIISKRLVEKFGGILTIDSRPGMGTEVSCRFKTIPAIVPI